MKKWFPSWPVTIVLFLIWILLNQSLDASTLLIAAVLGWFGPYITRRLRPLQAKARLVPVIVPLTLHILWDIFISNLAVAVVILGGQARRQRSGFIQIPLDLQDPHGQSVLAGIVTAIPGTVCAGFSDDRRMMTLHVLDLRDEGAWIRLIKARYERPLMEIYES
ncbi:Na+/H+ antiporter subunit E [Kerstersia sp.]|uniref:Na+/H+ antiporter subunit E n=1 Tax=Kerstersia sp. TaxID=1930783 RepID=UPI003F93E808